MKKSILKIIIMSTIILNIKITVRADTYADEWLKNKKVKQIEYMKELEKDGNLTEETYESITKKKIESKKVSQKKNKKENNGKGWVYSSDELHVIDLPEDKNTGYTIPGWYGEITK